MRNKLKVQVIIRFSNLENSTIDIIITIFWSTPPLLLLAPPSNFCKWGKRDTLFFFFTISVLYSIISCHFLKLVFDNIEIYRYKKMMGGAKGELRAEFEKRGGVKIDVYTDFYYFCLPKTPNSNPRLFLRSNAQNSMEAKILLEQNNMLFASQAIFSCVSNEIGI